MSIDLVAATYVDGYRIDLAFADGRTGVVDLKKYIEKGGVFSQLRDLNAFKHFEINRDFGTITWAGRVDIAPETLYSDATGEPLPEWMEDAAGLRAAS